MDCGTKEDGDEEAGDTGEEDLSPIYTPIEKIIHACPCNYISTHRGFKTIYQQEQLREFVQIWLPITTVMLQQMTFVRDRPANAHAYCDTRFPRPRTKPPAIANSTEGQLS